MSPILPVEDDQPGKHDPVIVPWAAQVDGVILRCDCGCGLYQTHKNRKAAEAARDKAPPP